MSGGPAGPGQGPAGTGTGTDLSDSIPYEVFSVRESGYAVDRKAQSRSE
ncbi:hypothetical protein SRIMHP_25200 [Streptomyces rimosus subsp. rimosus]|uniref:Uncharacterized protein n=1 Tax=Streptomyces rimosus subsp. rimosus TaxID=132474 RepID=A0ABY3Z7N4_STRRM|nr:hypothetical protein SRIMR7_27825 [Streptomyces rimosus subsp. rimosus]UTH97421.1 hypothetical protein SRIMHP_25200 [Streptomyces rimosus subsp. rimosus]UTJ15519.1 hypothetical protein SRIMDV3_25100 [Streptomyces rimosus subsp. rimosus]